MNPRIAWLLLAACVAGCGQKGPLYLPDTTQGEVVTRPAPAPAPADADAGAAPSATPAPDADEDVRNQKNGTPPPPGKR